MSVNQHPGCLDPKAPPGYDYGGKGMHGRRVMQTAILFCRRVERNYWTEAVAHRVGELDRGEVLGVRRVDINDRTKVDTPKGLKRRILRQEHALQVDVLRRLSNDTLRPIRNRPAHWLVKPDERDILDACKFEAIRTYPDG